MEKQPPDSGLDELLKLSRQMQKAEQDMVRQERAHTAKAQVTQGLKEIKLSVALEQLKLVAEPQIVAEVSSLRHKRSNDDLRDLILKITADLENTVDCISASNPRMKSLDRQVKTLAILIELLLSL